MSPKLKWIQCDASGCKKWRQLPKNQVAELAVSVAKVEVVARAARGETKQASIVHCRLEIGSVVRLLVAAAPFLAIIVQLHAIASQL